MFKNTFLLFCLIVQSFLIQAQQNFSLSEAVDYAIKESSRLKIQKFDIDDAKQQVREYYAIGLPKLKAGATYNYFLDIPTSILPDFLSPAVYGILFKENVIPSRDIDFGSGFPAQFGTSHNLSGNIEFSTLLFDGSFFVGLKAQKLYQELIYKQIHQTEADVKYQVTKAYLSALSTEESIQIINKNISNLEKVYHEMSEINKAGFVEKLDVDRLELSLENLRTEKEKSA
jgi:outer membrane protein TolC